MTELEAKLWLCLMVLTQQVNEDCPHEYRTRHLEDAIWEANDLIIDTQVSQGRMKL